MKKSKSMCMLMSLLMLFNSVSGVFAYENSNNFLSENTVSIADADEDSVVSFDSVEIPNYSEYYDETTSNSGVISLDAEENENQANMYLTENTAGEYYKNVGESENTYLGTTMYFGAPHTEVKSQVKGGEDSNNCWIFATLAAFESRLMKQNIDNTPDLSEEHVRQSLLEGSQANKAYRYCTNSANAKGVVDYVIAYLQRGSHYGAVYESNDLKFMRTAKNYLENNNPDLTYCDYYPSEIEKLPNLGEEFKADYATIKTRVNDIKRMVYENGNAIISYKSGSYDIQNRTDWSIINTKGNGKNFTQYHYLGDNDDLEGWHIVEIIGWDDNFWYDSLSSVPPNKGAFIAKNSYGNELSYRFNAGKGEYDGYIYIPYDEAYSFCDITSFKKLVRRSDMGNIYENSLLVNRNKELPSNLATSSSNHSTFVLSRFDLAQRTEALKSVLVHITDPDTRFKVYVSGSGETENLMECRLSNCDNYNEHGYKMNVAGDYVFSVEGSSIPLYGNSFLVGIEYYNPAEDIELMLENDSTLDDNKEKYEEDIQNLYPEISQGHSYILNTSVSYDNIRNINNYTDLSTKQADLCIKAYTTGSYSLNALSVGNSYSLYHNNQHTLTNVAELSEGNFIAFASKENPIISYWLSISDREEGGYPYTDKLVLGEKNSQGKPKNAIGFKVNGKCDIEIIYEPLNNSDTEISLNLYNKKIDSCNSISGAVSRPYGLYATRLSYNGNGDFLTLTGELGIYQIRIIPYLNPVNKRWNFSDLSYNQGYLNGSIEMNGLLLLSDSNSLQIKIEDAMLNLHGIEYRKCIKINEVGNSAIGSICLGDIPKNSYIYVTARNENGQQGSFKLINECNANIHTQTMDSDLQTYRFYYQGQNQQLFLTKNSGNIKIYSIGIVTKPDSIALQQKNWVFSDSDFAGLGRINENKSFDGLDLYATSNYYMAVKKNAVVVNNKTYTHYLATEGRGIMSHRQIGFDVNAGTDINVIARSSGNPNSERTLLVCDENNYLIAEFTLDRTAKQYTVTGDKVVTNGKIYIKTEDSSMNVFAILLGNQ